MSPDEHQRQLQTRQQLVNEACGQDCTPEAKGQKPVLRHCEIAHRDIVTLPQLRWRRASRHKLAGTYWEPGIMFVPRDTADPYETDMDNRRRLWALMIHAEGTLLCPLFR